MVLTWQEGRGLGCRQSLLSAMLCLPPQKLTEEEPKEEVKPKPSERELSCVLRAHVVH